MASNEGHIHWDGNPAQQTSYLGQALLVTSEDSNATKTTSDPIGSLRIKAASHQGAGLLLPNTTWQSIPGTSPALEVYQPGTSHRDYLAIRQA